MASNESEALRDAAREARQAPQHRAAKARSRRTRPSSSESLHEDDNKRLHQDNSSEAIAIDLHGIDLTQDATEWRRYSKMDAPDPLPGYAQRWVRARLAGKNDPTNVYKRVREGWRPRTPESVPEAGHLLPTIQLGQFGECIGVEDSILMQIPLKLYEQMRAHYRGRKAKQTAATENALLELGEQNSIPIHRGSRRVTTVGKAPRIAADD